MKDDWTWIRGKHTLKAGIENRCVWYNYSMASDNLLSWTSAATFAANKLDQVTLNGGVPMHGLRRTPSFGYIQDG